MFNNITKQHALQILRTQEELGLPVPAAIAKRHADITTVEAGLQRLHVRVDDIAHAAATAIIHGKDPAADPDIIRMLTARQLSQATITGPALEDAQVRFVLSLRDNTHELVEVWREAFAEAAAVLTDKRTDLGDVDLDTDAAEILNRGGDIAHHFVEARDADQRARLIVDQVTTHALVTGQQVSGDYRSLIMADVTLDECEDLDLHTRHTPWQLVKLGLTLDLAGPDEIRERIAGHEQTRTARDSTARDRAFGRRPELAAQYRA